MPHYKYKNAHLQSPVKSISYEKQIEEIENDRDHYERNPESHPNYASEWKSFYERRFNEIQRERFDPKTYDYKSEWIVYWQNYARDFYENKLIQLKNQYDRANPVIEIRDSSTYSSDSSQESRRRRLRKKRKYTRSNYKSPQKHNYYSTISDSDLSDADKKPKSLPSSKINPNESVTLISVLRIVSALDTELGLLSHKVIDLISKSLELEKLKANSSELLINNENVIFLETVKEKLKGLVSTGLLPEKKISTAKQCIQLIARLVHESSKKGQILSSSKIDLSSFDADKLELAGMIARELEAFGKTDCTTEELEVIIEIYLEELAKKDTKTKVNTVDDDFENITDGDLEILIQN